MRKTPGLHVFSGSWPSTSKLTYTEFSLLTLSRGVAAVSLYTECKNSPNMVHFDGLDLFSLLQNPTFQPVSSLIYLQDHLMRSFYVGSGHAA